MRLTGFAWVIFLSLAAMACKNSRQGSFEGSWLVVDIRADFDERRVNPATFNEIIAYLRDSKLEILNDSTLTFKRGGFVTKSSWYFDADSGSMVLKNKSLVISALKPLDGRLHTYEMSPLGRVELVFEKQKR